MTTIETEQGRRVRAEINYIRNRPPASAAKLEFVTEDEASSTMQTLPGVEMTIENARGLPVELDSWGFTLVEHTSQVSDWDLIEEDPDVDAAYGAEMTDLLTQVTGASRVLMLGGGKKRYGEREADKLAALVNAKPARYPHADNTDESVVSLLQAFGPDLDPDRFGRYAWYNLWRCVTPPPQDVPLAVCDARSVRPGDEVTVTAVTFRQRNIEYRHDTTSYTHNPGHRWHYFADMNPDEVLIFKAHDTDEARAGRVPHTAFDDPSCPQGVRARASVEMRGLALFE